MKSERSSLVRDSDLPKCRSAHTPVGAMWRRLGRTNWQGGEISQAGKHTSSMRRYDTKNEMKNMLYFVETTHEVAKTVVFRHVAVELIVDHMTAWHTFPDLRPLHRIMHNKRLV